MAFSFWAQMVFFRIFLALFDDSMPIEWNQNENEEPHFDLSPRNSFKKVIFHPRVAFSLGLAG